MKILKNKTKYQKQILDNKNLVLINIVSLFRKNIKNFIYIIFIIFLFFISNHFVYCQEINFDFFSNFKFIQLNEKSIFDPDLFDMNNFESLFYVNLKFLGRGEFYSFFMILSIYYYSNPIYNNITKSSIKIDEIYLNIFLNYFYINFGKKYFKWGSSIFFNPIDILNIKGENKLSSFENEGPSYLHLMIPFAEYFSLSFISFIKDDFYEKMENLPIITKINYESNNLSFFIFGIFQKNYRPIYGFNTEMILASKSFEFKIYNETVIKYQSDKTYFTNNLEELKYNDDKFINSLVGVNFTFNINNFDFLGQLLLYLEIYYNSENWDENQFKNFLLKYESLYDSEKLTLFGSYFNLFTNSKIYLWALIEIKDFLIEKFNFETQLIYNYNDESFLNKYGISYNTNNFSISISFFYVYGEKYSEFGNYLEKYQFAINLSCFF